MRKKVFLLLIVFLVCFSGVFSAGASDCFGGNWGYEVVTIPINDSIFNNFGFVFANKDEVTNNQFAYLHYYNYNQFRLKENMDRREGIVNKEDIVPIEKYNYYSFVLPGLVPGSSCYWGNLDNKYYKEFNIPLYELKVEKETIESKMDENAINVFYKKLHVKQNTETSFTGRAVG